MSLTKDKNSKKKLLHIGLIPVLAIITLVCIVQTIGLYPFVKTHFPIFFNQDPDPVYVSNALEYLYTGKIYMIDHPGTPLIVLLSWIFFPLRIYFKIFTNQSFTLWAIQNYDKLFLLTRTFLYFVFITGNLLIHFALYRITKSILANLLFASLILFQTIYLGLFWAITPEILVIFFIGLWINSVAYYWESKKIFYLFVSALISGLMLATKMNYLFFAVTSLGLIYISVSVNSNRLKQTVTGLLIVLSGYLVGVLALRRNILRLFDWIWLMFTHTGRQGTGNLGILDLSKNLKNLSVWFGFDRTIFILVLILIFYIVKNEKNKFWYIPLSTGIIGLIVFSKYSEVHYQLGNIILILISLCYIFSKLKSSIQIILLSAVLFLLQPSLRGVTMSIDNNLQETKILENFTSQFSPKNSLIWEYSNSKEFSLLRSKSWSYYYFRNELKAVYPNMYELNYTNRSKIWDLSGNEIDITDFCWDGLILQKDSWSLFIKDQKYAELFNKSEINGTSNIFITRNDCLKEKKLLN